MQIHSLADAYWLALGSQVGSHGEAVEKGMLGGMDSFRRIDVVGKQEGKSLLWHIDPGTSCLSLPRSSLKVDGIQNLFVPTSTIRTQYIYDSDDPYLILKYPKTTVLMSTPA
jgi:hypothetical protein